MAVAYESIQTVTSTSTTTLTITKPTGLAVGDYMFAHVIAQGTVFTTPSGWTALYNSSTSMSGGSLAPAVFYKQADSADVAASNFSFTNGVTNFKSGSLMRVSGFGIVDDSAGLLTSLSAGSPEVVASTIDPVYADGLALAFLFAADNAVNDISITAFSIATSNPTWTSRFNDARNSGSNSYAIRTYTASRPETTDWGNATLTFTQTGTGIGTLLVLASIAPRVDGSHTVTTAPMYVVNHPFIQAGELTLQGNDPTTRTSQPTQWANPSKESTTWNNETLP